MAKTHTSRCRDSFRVTPCFFFGGVSIWKMGQNWKNHRMNSFVPCDANNSPRSPLKVDMGPNKDSLYKVYMGFIIKGPPCQGAPTIFPMIYPRFVSSRLQSMASWFPTWHNGNPGILCSKRWWFSRDVWTVDARMHEEAVIKRFEYVLCCTYSYIYIFTCCSAGD